jgi:glycosyltransferase involved in cell wall biosynthesis
MAPKRTILVVSFTDLASDPRVSRQIEGLVSRYEVIAAGTGHPGLQGVRFLNCPRVPRTFAAKATEAAQLLLRRYERYYWGQRHVTELLRRSPGLEPDAVIANDIESLPVALKIARGGKVILDAHEYAPREFEDRPAWRLIRQPYVSYLCANYIPRVSAMMTVADGIAAEYEKRFAVHAEVILNAPHHRDLEPSPAKAGRIRMIHHGGAIPERRLELMLELMRHLDNRFTLDLLLQPTVPRYLAFLMRSAARQDRVRFLRPVPMRQLIPFANSYDIGLFLLPPSNFNYQHALPNKFFEFIQSRIAVAIGPSPEMARLVKQYGCGIVAPDFSPASLAGALNNLQDEDLKRLKQAAGRAASDLCFERVSAKLLSLVARTLGEA